MNAVRIKEAWLPSGIDVSGLGEFGAYEDGGWYFWLPGCPVPFWAEERPETAGMTPAEAAKDLRHEAEECLLGVVGEGPGARFAAYCPTTERYGLCDADGRLRWTGIAPTANEAVRELSWLMPGRFKVVTGLEDALSVARRKEIDHG